MGSKIKEIKKRRRRKKRIIGAGALDPDLTDQTGFLTVSAGSEPEIIQLQGDFSMARRNSPMLLSTSGTAAPGEIHLALTLPKPSHIYFVDVEDSVASRRLEDFSKIGCPPRGNILTSLQRPRGEFQVALSGTKDSVVVLCSMEAELLGVYLHVITPSGPPSGPFMEIKKLTSSPTPSPTNTILSSETVGGLLGGLLSDDPTSTETVPTASPTRIPTQRPTLVPTRMPTQKPTPANDSTKSAGYYDSFSWSDLPEDVQVAAGVLGYDKKMWNRGTVSESDQKYWSQLSSEEHLAAAVLLYDEATWNDAVEETFTCSNLEELYWEEIPQELKSPLVELGYSQAAWDTSDPAVAPPVSELEWAFLSRREKILAQRVGYDESGWNNGC